jgi:hypothetical protein
LAPSFIEKIEKQMALNKIFAQLKGDKGERQ